MKGIADILLGSVSKYLFSSRKMALATAFGQNSGPDRYPDLGRLSCGHTSLVGRFGRCVPKSASRLNFVSDNRSMGAAAAYLALRVCTRECFAVVADTSLPVEVRIGLNRGHWP